MRRHDRAGAAVVAAAGLWAAGLCGCGDPQPVEVTGVVRDGRTGQALGGAVVRAAGGQTDADAEGRFTLRMREGEARLVRAAYPSLCPGEARVDVRAGGMGEVTLNLFARLELAEEQLQVGFGSEVRIEARTRCDEAAPLRWEQISGPELGADRMRIEDGGRVVVVRTHALEDMIDLDANLGVIPFSRKERAEYRLRLEAELGGREVRREVRVTAGPTAAGVFQVPTGADLYLNGGAGAAHRWTLQARPDESQAELLGADTRTPRLRPDRFGQYLIRHETLGVDINVQAGAYQEVPRDCGREGCHRAEADGWEGTAHARTFRRGLEGELGAGFDERCWSCHATGVDPGVANGGLHQTARSIGWTQPEPRAGLWDEAPRLMRRHGSVWCSACHGPGRILPPPFHWEYGAKYQAGVCARCHDATDDPDSPHQSWQYQEWASSPMSTFLDDGEERGPATRRGCAQCHSTQGFVAWMDGDASPAPAEETVVAIHCAACHDPHDARHPSALRAFETIEDVSGRSATRLGAGAICVNCHRSGLAASGDDSMAPHAPQADVLLGRGSQLVRTSAPGVHAQLAGSCVACHMARPQGDDPLLGRAGGHTFSVRDLGASGARPILASATCAGCHGSEVPPQAIGGYRDWDGDGRADNVGEELHRGLEAVRTELRARIGAARVRDGCGEGRLAEDFVELDARLILIDREGLLLGDCDEDGAFTRRERAVGVEQLSRDLRRLLWDVALLEGDGSHGRHNPSYAFDILRALRRELR